MKKIEKKDSQRLFDSLSKLILIFVTLVSFIIILREYYGMLNLKGNIVLVFLYLFIFGLLAGTYKCFDIGVLRIRELVLSYLITIILTNFIAYLIMSLVSRELINIIPILFLMVLQGILSTMFYWNASKVFYSLHPARDAVVICQNSPHDLDFISKFNHYKMRRYNILLVCFESEEYNKLIDYIDEYSTVILGDINNDLRKKILSYCFEKNKRLILMPSIQDILMHNAHLTQVLDTPAFVFKNEGASIEQMVIKRGMDILFSFLGILILSPVLLLCAVSIKLYDRGPVFFKQARYTVNMKKFTILKFRSMIIDAEKNGPQLTTDEDERITPIGRFIRKTHIDELPQLFNILKGDMSLVGPRAERIENVEIYSRMMPEFCYRMKVKAGLTGYAQIYGKYNTVFTDKLKMDLFYIENFSLFLDFQLLLATIKVIFVKENTEGFENMYLLTNDISKNTDINPENLDLSSNKNINFQSEKRDNIIK
jgi:exopolysaccharide biosynthesis polyprenyl glycosylphosphotransferase